MRLAFRQYCWIGLCFGAITTTATLAHAGVPQLPDVSACPKNFKFAILGDDQAKLTSNIKTALSGAKDGTGTYRVFCPQSSLALSLQKPLIIENTSDAPLIVFGVHLDVSKILTGPAITLSGTQPVILQNVAIDNAKDGIKIVGANHALVNVALHGSHIPQSLAVDATAASQLTIVGTTISDFDSGLKLVGAGNVVRSTTITGTQASGSAGIDGTMASALAISEQTTVRNFDLGVKLIGPGHSVRDAQIVWDYLAGSAQPHGTIGLDVDGVRSNLSGLTVSGYATGVWLRGSSHGLCGSTVQGYPAVPEKTDSSQVASIQAEVEKLPGTVGVQIDGSGHRIGYTVVKSTTSPTQRTNDPYGAVDPYAQNTNSANLVATADGVVAPLTPTSTPTATPASNSTPTPPPSNGNTIFGFSTGAKLNGPKLFVTNNTFKSLDLGLLSTELAQDVSIEPNTYEHVKLAFSLGAVDQTLLAQMHVGKSCPVVGENGTPSDGLCDVKDGHDPLVSFVGAVVPQELCTNSATTFALYSVASAVGSPLQLVSHCQTIPLTEKTSWQFVAVSDLGKSDTVPTGTCTVQCAMEHANSGLAVSQIGILMANTSTGSAVVASQPLRSFDDLIIGNVVIAAGSLSDMTSPIVLGAAPDAGSGTASMGGDAGGASVADGGDAAGIAVTTPSLQGDSGAGSEVTAVVVGSSAENLGGDNQATPGNAPPAFDPGVESASDQGSTSSHPSGVSAAAMAGDGMGGGATGGVAKGCSLILP